MQKIDVERARFTESLTFAVSPEMKEVIKKIMTATGKTQSIVLREALVAYVQHHNKKVGSK